MSGRYSTNGSTSLSAVEGSASLRAPIHNPYDKFSKPQFDAFISDITGALRDALGGFDYEAQQKQQAAEKSTISSRSYSHAEHLQGGESISAVLRRQRKGKGRDPAEGPGLFAESAEQEALSDVDDSGEEEVERLDAQSDDEDEESGSEQSYEDEEEPAGRYYSDEDEQEQEVEDGSSDIEEIDDEPEEQHGDGRQRRTAIMRTPPHQQYEEESPSEEEEESDEEGSWEDEDQEQVDDEIDSDGSVRSASRSPAAPEAEVIDLLSSDEEEDDQDDVHSGSKHPQVRSRSEDDERHHSRLSQSPPREEEADELTPHLHPTAASPEADDQGNMSPFVASKSVSPVVEQPFGPDPWGSLKHYAEDFYAGGDNIGGSLNPDQLSTHLLSGDDRIGTPLGMSIDGFAEASPFEMAFDQPEGDAPVMDSFRWSMPSPQPELLPSLEGMGENADSKGLDDVEVEELEAESTDYPKNPLALPEDFRLDASGNSTAAIEAIQYVSVPSYMTSQPISDGDDDSQSEDEDEDARYPPLGTSDLDHDAYPPRASDEYFSDEDADHELEEPDVHVEEVEEEDEITEIERSTDRASAVEPAVLRISPTPIPPSPEVKPPALRISVSPSPPSFEVMNTDTGVSLESGVVAAGSPNDPAGLPIDGSRVVSQLDAIQGPLEIDELQEIAVDAPNRDALPSDVDATLPSIVVDTYSEIPEVVTDLGPAEDSRQVLPPVCADPDMLDPVEFSPEPDISEFMVAGLFTPANISLPESPAASGLATQQDELIERIMVDRRPLDELLEEPSAAELLEATTSVEDGDDTVVEVDGALHVEQPAIAVSTEGSGSVASTQLEDLEQKRDAVHPANLEDITIKQQPTPEDTFASLPAAESAVESELDDAGVRPHLVVDEEAQELGREQSPTETDAAEDQLLLAYPSDEIQRTTPPTDQEIFLNEAGLVDLPRDTAATTPEHDDEVGASADRGESNPPADEIEGWTIHGQGPPDPSDPNEDPFKLMGSDSAFAPGEVHNDTPQDTPKDTPNDTPKEELPSSAVISIHADTNDTSVDPDDSTEVVANVLEAGSPSAKLPLSTDDAPESSAVVEGDAEDASAEDATDSLASTPSADNRDSGESPVYDIQLPNSTTHEELRAPPDERRDEPSSTALREDEQNEEPDVHPVTDTAEVSVSSSHSDESRSDVIKEAESNGVEAGPTQPISQRASSPPQSRIPKGEQARSSKRKRQDSDIGSHIPRPKIQRNASSRSTLSGPDGVKSKGKGKERERISSPSSSSGASATLNLLKTSSAGSSRASSVTPPENAAVSTIANEAGSSQDSQPANTILLHKHRPNPVRHHSHLPTLVVQPNQQRSSQPQQTQPGPSQKPKSHPDNAESPTTPSSTTSAQQHRPNYTPARVDSSRLATGSSPITRSNCRFRRISVPREEGGPRVYFIVPGCSLNDRELMDDEEIADHGDATISDSQRMVDDVGSLDFVSEYLLGVLRQLVGLDLLREQEVYYLPQPGEEIRRRSTTSKATISRRATRESFGNGPSVYGSKPAEPAYSPGKSSLLRPPMSASNNSISTASTSASKGRLRNLRYSASVSSAELEQHSDTDDGGPPIAKKPKLATIDQEPEPGSSQASQADGKKKSIRRRKIAPDAAAYTPGQDEEGHDDDDEDEEQGQRKRKKKRGVKRTRTSEIPVAASNNGDGNPSKPKRQRKRGVDKDVSSATIVPEADDAEIPQVEE